MVTVRMNKGLPASGKSTDAERWVKENPNGRIVIFRDEIRLMLGPYWVSGKREKLVSKIEDYSVVEGAKRGYDVTIDATNLRLNADARFKKMLDEAGVEYTFEVVDFTHVTVEECIRRDSLRVVDPNGRGPVGEEVINRMAKQHLGYE